MMVEWFIILGIIDLSALIGFLCYRMWQNSCESKLRLLKLKEEFMSQNNYHVYVLDEEPRVYIYTTSKNDNTIALIKDLGFKFQYTVYTYGWSVRDGLMYSLPVYLDMGTSDVMLKLARISNGTDVKIRAACKEVYIAKGLVGKKWYQHYSK